MVSRVTLDGFEAFSKFWEEADPKGPPVIFYFSGSKLPSGESWCGDCNEAEPIVDSYLSELTENIIFVHVNVGNREYWKDKACPFRTDARTRLMVIPTLLRWKSVQRLEGSQCNNRELLHMLFSNEEE